MVRTLGLATKNSSFVLSKEQKALQSLMHLFRSTFQYRTKCLMTTTDSALFQYFEEKQPPYRILKGGKTALIPIYQNEDLWGLIQIQSFETIEKASMDKVRNAIKDILLPALHTPQSISKRASYDKLNVFLHGTLGDDAIKITLDILDHSPKNCMIYWEALNPAPQKIGDLYELQDTLIFVKEILSLTPDQRTLFALYLNLPKKLRGAQIVLSSSSNYQDLKKLLHGETLFLETLQKHRTDIATRYSASTKNEILKNILSSINLETSYSQLI